MTFTSTVMVGSSSVVLLTLVGLSYLNPNLTDYQEAVLIPAANREADAIARTDRRAIEQEATRLATTLAAVHYDPERLDALEILKNHPLLGPSFIHQNKSKDRTMIEPLVISKDHALRRVAAIYETMRSSALVKLRAQTTRHSYGLWSYFSTCLDTERFSYVGMNGRFYERSKNECSTVISTR